IARAFLDRGANPNVYFMAGDSRYTPLTGAIGEGEEGRPAHQQRDALVWLLLERGANPYDQQVIYNIHFNGKVLWFLKLIYEHRVTDRPNGGLGRSGMADAQRRRLWNRRAMVPGRRRRAQRRAIGRMVPVAWRESELGTWPA